MQKAVHACHANDRDHFTSPRQHVASLLCAMAELNVELHPVHGLFENRMQGYRAEFHPTEASMKNRITALSIYLHRAAHQFLARNEQGHLFVNVELPLLLSPSFINQLNTLMQQTPALSERLVLLLSEKDLYPNSDIEHSLALINAAGIQLGIEINNSHRFARLMNNNKLKVLASACILIRYSNNGMQQQYNIDALSRVIQHCRSKNWPLLVDYQQHGNRRVS